MSSPVDKIKERLSVDEVVGSYIKLEKSGINFKAKCPFHNEKTPSFFVSPARGTFYCFGCGAKGDIFSFVQEFEGLDFREALKMLADRAGVQLPKEKFKSRSERDRLYDALSKATVFYQDKLKENKEVLGYLKKRGLTEKTLNNWQVGFAPKAWRNLSQRLFQEKFTEKELLRAGLVKKSDHAGRSESVYDVFRSRIIFPIYDSSGRIVGMSGRLFGDEDGPKYLNTPETELFNKGETLYGLHVAKTAIRQKNYSILVEGQMDLLMCHQEGFANAVASSGTAFTEAHLMRLKKLSNRILLVFDGDDAGFLASQKSAALSLTLGMEVKVAPLPRGMDPAEMIAKDKEAWKLALRSSKHIIDHYLDTVMEQGVSGRNLAKAIKEKILPYVELVPSAIEKSQFVSSIAKKTGIREEAVWDDLRTVERIDASISYPISDKETIKKELQNNFTIRRVAGLIFWLQNTPEPIIEYKPFEERVQGIVGKEGIKNLLEEYHTEKEELIFEVESYYDKKETLEKDLAELLALFEEDILRDHFLIEMTKLEKAERDGKEEDAKKILSRCQDISIRLSQIKKQRADLDSLSAH